MNDSVVTASSSPESGRGMTSTAWTRRLQILTAVGSFVFTIGTALQTFVVVDLDLLKQTMQLAGMTAVEAAESAPGFRTGFRVVGCLFLVGNALGMLAPQGWTWVFWLVIAINVGQAGKRVEVAVVGVIGFAEGLIAHERRWRDQASVLVRLDLLPTAGLPVNGLEIADRLRSLSGLPVSR